MTRRQACPLRGDLDGEAATDVEVAAPMLNDGGARHGYSAEAAPRR